jgi:hypothetical protein
MGQGATGEDGRDDNGRLKKSVPLAASGYDGLFRPLRLDYI